MRRIMVSGANTAHVNSIVKRIEEELKIPKHKHGTIWGNSNEDNICLTVGPAEAMIMDYMINHRTIDIEKYQKMYDALTHIIISPVVDDQEGWTDDYMTEGLLQAVYNYLRQKSKVKGIPTIILRQRSKDDNWDLIVSLITGIQL